MTTDGLHRLRGRIAQLGRVSLCGLLLASAAAQADEWKARPAGKQSESQIQPVSGIQILPRTSAGRSRTSTESDQQQPRHLSAVYQQDVVPAPAENHAPLKNTQTAPSAEPPAVGTSPGGHDVATAPVNAPALAAEAKPDLVSAITRGTCGEGCADGCTGELGCAETSASRAPFTWSEIYSQRMEELLNGRRGDDQSLAQWWHTNSIEFQFRNRHLVESLDQLREKSPAVAGGLHSSGPQETLMHGQQEPLLPCPDLHGSIRNFVAEHTLPPYDLPADAIYDAKPRAVAMGPVRTVSGQEDDKVDSRVARLTRNITTIQPTLSYALKDIPDDQLPADFHTRMDNGEYVAKQNSPTVMQWAPTNLYHYPLYFEDPALERYGHTYHPLVQPFASSGRFATQLVGLPYQMTLHPACAKEYTLGWYRPGDWAPKKTYQIPFNEVATLMQAAVVAGLILIIP